MHLPEWFKVKISGIHRTKNLLRKYSLYSVCEEARCPNKSRCFSLPTATFLILGDTCTRNCAFCSVKSGNPDGVDFQETERIVKAAGHLGLRYIVITSVTRDDLSDGGAFHFADTIKAIKNNLPGVRVEVLTPDFGGNVNSLKSVLDAMPDVFNHNIETVKRLYNKVRPQADYERSINVLKNAKHIAPDIKTKSGLMLGFGETFDEVTMVLKDLRNAGCNFLTIGQYLRPSRKNIPVVEYIKPDEFERLRKEALSIGFDYVASGPLVRSSMNAHEAYNFG